MPAQSPLAGKKLSDAVIRQQAGVIVLAVKNAEGKTMFNPPESAEIRPGDCLIVIGADAQLKKESLVEGPVLRS